MRPKFEAGVEAAAIRIETNSKKLRVTNISMGHTIRIAHMASFPPAALLAPFMAAIVLGLLGVRTIWGWVIGILVSALVCWFILGLFIGFCCRCFVWAFNATSGGDNSGIVVRVRELTDEEEHRDPDSYTV